METLQRTANRGSVSTGYDIDNSIMFSSVGTYADANSLFYDQISTSDGWAANSNAGTNARKLTVSCWFKRTALTESSHYPRLFDYRAGGVAFAVYFNTSDQLQMYDDNTSMSLISTQVFRDLSAWSHIVVQIDSTQATASDRVNVYINGEKITAWATEDYGNQNVDLSPFRTTGTNNFIGSAAFDYSTALNGYIAEFHFIDGSTVAHTEFGETDEDSGIWKPKQYTGSYGILGHYYDFSDSTDMGEDFSGNNNDSNNRGSGITNGAARQATDTPTNNFCTISTLQPYASTTVISDGATKMGKTAATWQTAFATMGITSGKWYWEYKTSEADNMTGIADIDTFSSFGTSNYLGQTATSWGYYAYNGKYINNSTETTYGNTFNSTNIIGVALDMDNNKLYFAKDNTWQNSGDPTSGATGTGAISITSGIYYTPSASIYDNGDEQEFNFGGYTTISIASAASDANGYGTFEYAPPSGYYALCTKNLAEYG